MLFAELAQRIVAPRGRVGLLVPSGIATDATTKEFFGSLMDARSLIALYDFENRSSVFPDVDGRFKFCILLFGGKEIKTKAADFVFFAHRMEDLGVKKRHIALSKKDLALLNPNTHTCAIFRSRRDAELTKEFYRNVPILVDRSRKEGGNPWGIKFCRMFDQTNDAEHFRTAEELAKLGCKLEGNHWHKGQETYLPLYEAKMVQAYDHRAAGVVVQAGNWVRQGQTEATTPMLHQNPEFVVQPRWWVDQKLVQDRLAVEGCWGFLGFKDITSATNRRTMIASAIPWSALTNHCPLLLTDVDPRLQLCLLANLNSFALDYVARQKTGGVTLNFFIVEQFPIFSPGPLCRAVPVGQTHDLGAVDLGSGVEADLHGARHAPAGRGSRHGPAASQMECDRAPGTDGRIGRRVLSPLRPGPRRREVSSRHVPRIRSGRRIRRDALRPRRPYLGRLRPFGKWRSGLACVIRVGWVEVAQARGGASQTEPTVRNPKRHDADSSERPKPHQNNGLFDPPTIYE